MPISKHLVASFPVADFNLAVRQRVLGSEGASVPTPLEVAGDKTITLGYGYTMLRKGGRSLVSRDNTGRRSRRRRDRVEQPAAQQSKHHSKLLE
jgi:hypothetical protein